MLCRRAPAPKRRKNAKQAAPAGPKASKWGRCPHHPRCMLLPHLHWSGMRSGDILLHCRRTFGFRLPWIPGCWRFRVEACGFKIPCRRWFKFQAPSRDRCLYIHEFDSVRPRSLWRTGAACADEFCSQPPRRAFGLAHPGTVCPHCGHP